MKKIIPFIVFIALTAFLTNCKKKNSNKDELAGSFIGTWELRQTSAAMNPTINNYPPGNGKILKLTETGYELLEAGQLIKKGNYTIVADATVKTSVCLEFPEGQFTHRIIYDGDNSSEKQFLQVTGNKLSIVAGCYAVDAGHRSDYEKLSVK